MPELPDETRLNQVVAWLSAGRYAQADSLAFDLPDTGIYHKAKVYAAALNGRYNESTLATSRNDGSFLNALSK